ncbi:core-2/I-Branching enzyme family protein [Clostridium baratii str. Sullivan]|uniref:Peptide O-xylosyltransferase n=1 Tax=Clostridium baratii str. Sullivan TaxID=1415775 RepID=A0A0A7FV30_9CLOT|nr:beta-1,6-N-acetylglucosaminyltransferase [Clostridium baratii]AIY83433.1 core-2/I-Branching enzyme family protein [Clostridium baratii str. Sullivan]
MKVIYGVLCNKNSIVLKNMLDILSKDNKIFIHVDLKSDIEEFSEYKSYKNVEFIKNRVCVNWGEFSLTQATLNIINSAKNMEYDYISIISGDCLPLKSDSLIKEFLEKNNGKEFIGVEKSFNKKELENRVKYIYPRWRFNKKCTNVNLLLKIKRTLQIKLCLFKKNSKFKNLPKLYKGCNWFTISKDLVEYITKYLNENGDYIEAFQNSFCSDEVFFQTIVMNSKFRNNVYRINENIDDNIMSLRYIDWKSGPEYPKILSENDFEKIKNTECIIGRKFNSELDFDKYYKFIER